VVIARGQGAFFFVVAPFGFDRSFGFGFATFAAVGANDVWKTFTFSFLLEDTRRVVAAQEGDLHVGAGAVAVGLEEGDREREGEREERERQNNPFARHHHLDDTA
jgi:hypothetical protein